MPGLWHRVRSGAGRDGGIVGYPLDQLQEEVAYIAYHFHWPLEQILSLEHTDRRQWVEQISKINRRLNGEEAAEPVVDWEALRAKLGQRLGD